MKRSRKNLLFKKARELLAEEMDLISVLRKLRFYDSTIGSLLVP